MQTVQPARLKAGVSLNDIPAPQEQAAGSTALIRGRALVFWDPKVAGKKLDAIDKKILGMSKTLLDTKCLVSSIEICATAILREKLNAAWWNRYFGIPFKIVFSIAFMWLFFMVARLYLEYFIGFWE